jgi:hypothetical protein
MAQKGPRPSRLPPEFAITMRSSRAPVDRLVDRLVHSMAHPVRAQVTSGEHYFAPRPIEAAQPPEIQEARKARRNNILHLIRRDRPSPTTPT